MSYICKADYSDDNLLMVEFPENIFNGRDKITASYHYDGEQLIVNDKKIKCPKYSARVLVGTDILLKLEERNLFITNMLFNNAKIKKIRKVVTKLVSLDSEDSAKELLLYEAVLKKVLMEKVEVKEDIVDGYEIFCDLIKCGGINVT
jgi:hypothetical protein